MYFTFNQVSDISKDDFLYVNLKGARGGFEI